MLSSSICRPCSEKKRASVGMMTRVAATSALIVSTPRRRRRIDHDEVELGPRPAASDRAGAARDRACSSSAASVPRPMQCWQKAPDR